MEGLCLNLALSFFPSGVCIDAFVLLFVCVCVCKLYKGLQHGKQPQLCWWAERLSRKSSFIEAVSYQNEPESIESLLNQTTPERINRCDSHESVQTTGTQPPILPFLKQNPYVQTCPGVEICATAEFSKKSLFQKRYLSSLQSKLQSRR